MWRASPSRLRGTASKGSLLAAFGLAAAVAHAQPAPQPQPAPAPPEDTRVRILMTDDTCASGLRVAYRIYDADGNFVRLELGRCQR